VDSEQFDALVSRLSSNLSRRRSLGALSLLGSASIGLAGEAEARKKKKKGKGKRKKPKGTTTQPPTTPPATTTTTGPQTAYECFSDEFQIQPATAGTIRIAQTFLPTKNGSLQRVSFFVGKPAGSPGDFVVQLLVVIGNTPSHLPQDVLAETIVSNSEVSEGSPSVVNAFFTNGPQLAVGTQYAVAVSRHGTGTYERTYSDTLNCGGRMFVAEDGQPFVAQNAQRDAIVRVRVQ
jgi:hypothetical protein